MGEKALNTVNEWIFTFGCGTKRAGKCVRIKGTYDDARAEMFRLFGPMWAFQYSAEEWEELKKKHGNDFLEKEYPVEDLL